MRRLRESQGLTQEELGKALGGIGKAAIQKIESGRTSIGVDKLMVLCELFKVFPSSILYGGLTPFWDVVGAAGEGADSPSLKDEHLLGRLDALAEERLGPKGLSLIVEISHLNDEGIERAAAYVSDLAKIEGYRRGCQPNSN